MKRGLLHTPEGVRDIYNDECEKKLYLQGKLSRTLSGYGYHPIETPAFEFFDIFGKEVGTVPSNELYKFFDRDGNTLVLRPDITPSIARSAAKYYMDEEMPLRFCYVGNTYINHSSLQGRLKEVTQIGAELMGDDSVDADAEILAMAVDCLLQAGLTDFQISVGHAEILQGMVEAAGFTEEEEELLRNLLSNKNFFGVEEFVAQQQIPQDLKKLFSVISGFYHSTHELELLKQQSKNYKKVQDAVIHLENLHQVLSLYGIDKYISFEPGMISNYHYYTGILLSGYTFGSGEPIITGGRYNKLMHHFGKDAASIGFAIVLDQLMAALSRQKIGITITHDTQLIVYTKENQKKAILTAKEVRSSGNKVELISMDAQKPKSDYEDYAARNHITRITFMDGE